MNSLRVFFSRLRNLSRREQLERELNDELDAHLELHTADNLRAGMSPAEARRVALLKLGGLEQTKESVREQRTLLFLETFVQDIRLALRMLRKSPGFTTVAVLTLALGIGANTAIFSAVNSVLLRSLPFPHPSELVDISARSTLYDFTSLGMSLPDIAEVRSGASSFAALATYQDSPRELSGGSSPVRLESTEVSEDFFPVLGIRPLHGRTFTSSDLQSGSRAVVLGYSLWRERFGGDPSTIGKTITLDGQPHTVIGIMPALPHLGFATDSRLWTALLPTNKQLTARDSHDYSVLARLKPHTSVARAEKELDTIAARLQIAYPDFDKGWSIHATSLKQFLLGDARPPLTILFCAVGFVLLIACANVSNLFLSRGYARRREFAIRAAMGATRKQLLRQLAVECLLVALAGGACAFLFTIWTIQALRSILPPEFPRLQDIRMDSTVAWFTLGASLLAAALSGLAPALLRTRQDLSVAIKESSGGTGMSGSSAGHNFWRQLLVVSEVALAVILLIGATLAVRSFGRLLRLDLGFRPDHLLTLRLDFPKFRFASPKQAITLVQQLLDETRISPGVASASAGLVFPMSDEVGETTFETETTASDPKLGQQSALGNRAAPDFFRTLGIPLLVGRDFSNGDAKGNSPVFVVNEALARQYFGNVNVAGKRFSSEFASGRPVWGQIIGVVGNVREAALRAEPKPQVYAPFYQTSSAFGVYLVVRSKSDPLAIVPVLQERIWSVDKTQPITAIATVEARIAEVHAGPRSQSILLGFFGVVGFLLALIGVYGVISYLVSLQTREIGIRMALGAHPAQVLRLVVVHGLKLTLGGVLIGIPCGLALTRYMSSMLFGIGAHDLVTFAGVPVSFTVVAVVACLIPARRATRVDPMIALRYE